MAFKANSDDTRNSVSFKLRKQLEFRGYDVRCVDPHVPGYEDWSALKGVDALVLMTPHKEFADLTDILRRTENPNGYFFGKEAVRLYEETTSLAYKEAM
jgi:UDP-N-acetyl-D-mannosaminuronic acid dehydrogenase